MSVFVGVVSFVKDSTARVKVKRVIEHAVYKKRITTYKNIACNISSIDVSVGDSVEIISCRPISKTKSFEVAKLLQKAEAK